MKPFSDNLSSRILAGKLFVCLIFALGSAHAQEAAPWQVELNWIQPTQNVDGSALTDLAGYKIYFGTSPQNYGTPVEINDPDLTSYTITPSAPGGYYFAMTSIDAEGNESARSNTIFREVQTAPAVLTSAVLPSSRSVQVGDTATAFATVINSGQDTGSNCAIAPASPFSGTFWFQETNPLTNEPVGTLNEPVDIGPSGQVKTFIFGLQPSSEFTTTDLELSFTCDNASTAQVIVGVNTLSASASNSPVPDIVALGATTSNDAIVHVPFRSASGFFTVATVNAGADGFMQASVNTGQATLPLTLSLCETDPLTSVCINPTTPTTGEVASLISAGETPTFAIFVSTDVDLDLDPAQKRVYVNFEDDSGIVRGSTSVAVRTRQFSQDLQPVLELNCTNGCHQPGGSAPFSLEAGASYDSLLSRGLVVPGDPDNSDLIQRLEGTSGQRMPLGAAPLPDNQIQMFRQWISAGAPNDEG